MTILTEGAPFYRDRPSRETILRTGDPIVGLAQVNYRIARSGLAAECRRKGWHWRLRQSGAFLPIP